MEAAEAISLVTEFILWRDLGYATEGLEAKRFDAGWCVCSGGSDGVPGPAHGVPVFLAGDWGCIEEVSSSVPLPQAQAEFAAEELAAQRENGGSDESQFLVEFKRQIRRGESEVPSAVVDFTLADTPSGDENT